MWSLGSRAPASSSLGLPAGPPVGGDSPGPELSHTGQEPSTGLHAPQGDSSECLCGPGQEAAGSADSHWSLTQSSERLLEEEGLEPFLPSWGRCQPESLAKMTV